MRGARALALLPLLLAPGRLEAAASEWVGDARAAIRLVSALEATGAGDRIEAGLAFRLAPGWHTYWRSPGDAGFAPRIDWSGSENVRSVTVAWPAPARHVQAGLRSNVYDRSMTMPLTVVPERPGEAVRLQASVDFAGCARICIPYHGTLSLKLPAGPSSPSLEAPSIAAGRLAVPGTLAEAGLGIVRVGGGARAGSRLTVQLRSLAGPLVQPDVFVEQGGEVVPGTVQVAEGGAVAWIHVSRPQGGAGPPPGVTTVGAGPPLIVTIVDGTRAAEWSIP